MLKQLALFATTFVFSVSSASAAVIYTADFEGIVDQAPLVASDGDASTSFSANSSIGSTSAAGFASTGANLATRNGTRGYITVADSNFTTATGNVAQLHTHTSGGFSVLSVAPVTTIGGVNNQPTPIAITPVVGDTYRVTFDMYVQATRTLTSNLAVNWNLKDSSLAVVSFTDTWDDFKNASVGDVVSVTKDLVITSGMVAAGVTSFGPQFTFTTNSGDIPTNTPYAQIDNFQIDHIAAVAVPEPSSAAFLLLSGLGFLRRRR